MVILASGLETYGGISRLSAGSRDFRRYLETFDEISISRLPAGSRDFRRDLETFGEILRHRAGSRDLRPYLETFGGISRLSAVSRDFRRYLETSGGIWRLTAASRDFRRGSRDFRLWFTVCPGPRARGWGPRYGLKNPGPVQGPRSP